jgi:hypothetical protein
MLRRKAIYAGARPLPPGRIRVRLHGGPYDGMPGDTTSEVIADGVGIVNECIHHGLNAYCTCRPGSHWLGCDFTVGD